jgi:hypothetical protein
MQLLFTLLRDAAAWEAAARSDILVALGDLAFRFPNALEPWTQHLYGSRENGSCLHDPDPAVRHDALMVCAPAPYIGRRYPRWTPTALSLRPTVNGDTVRSFSTHGHQSAAKGSLTTVSRSDIRLIQYFDSLAHALVRRWF